MNHALEVFLLGVLCLVGSALIVLGLIHHDITVALVGVFELGMAYLAGTTFKFGSNND